jgi:prophage DNA circulation protein
MTIFNTAKLPIASFKGVSFHYQDSSIDGGRKTVTHEYPDTNIRYVEDLGKLEKTFSITAIIDTNVSFSDRDSLIRVLEEEGVGVLIHPTFGEQNVALKGYTVADNINELGISRFNLTFEVAELNKFPQTTKGNKGFLSRLKSAVLGDSETAFDNGWSSVKNAKARFDSANASLKRTGRELRRASQLVQGSADTFSDFATSINELIDSSASLVQSPSILASKIRTTFDNLEVAYDNSQDVFDTAKALFGFNSSESENTGTSQQQQSIVNNQNQLNNIINASALALAYNAAGNINYRNLDELSAVNSILEDGFDNLPTELDREVYQSILDLRVEINDIFSNLSLSLARVVDSKTKKTSLNVLAYSLYGSLKRKNDVRDLNQFIDTSRIEGDIKILSNV